MNMATNSAVSLLKKAYLRRWELIFGRINLKKQQKFDFRDITVDIPKNLPANDVELTDQMLKLRELISNQTIIERLGYNYISEQEKKADEAEQAMAENIERMKTLERSGIDPQTGQPVQPTEEQTERPEEQEEPVNEEENSGI